MPSRWPAWATPMFAYLLLCGLPVSAQDLALTVESEFGFRRLIQSAQSGELGDDVTNANVFVQKNKVRVELVRTGGPNKLLLLTRRGSSQSLSRYFNIEPDEGATADDAARVGKALDKAFAEDPFEVAWDYFGIYAHESLPSLAEAWSQGGLKSVLRVLEGQLIAPTGTPYAIAVIIALAIGLVMCLALLWGSEPHRAVAPDTDRE